MPTSSSWDSSDSRNSSDSENLSEFFPTPALLINQMFEGIDFRLVSSVLEPSAGKGDIVKALVSKLKYGRNYGYNYSTGSCCDDSKIKAIIDCIEINKSLKHILKGEGFRIVHDDFLTYSTKKQYDLIIMNPPFSNGDAHLLKAIDLAQNGGRIVCLLNAETIKNPYSNNRKLLARKLSEHEASIKFISNAFENAERKTGVEIAVVSLSIPKNKALNSIILENLKKEKQRESDQFFDPETMVHSDFVQAFVERYKFEVDCGVRLINEYQCMIPYMLNSLHRKKEDEVDYRQPILNLSVDKKNTDRSENITNDYVRTVRLKYWKALFEAPEFISKLTSNLQTDLYNKVEMLGDYEFSRANILEIQAELSANIISSVESTILKLFDDLSAKYSYIDETSKNIHLFNGWKTNKAHKINSKVIIPACGMYDKKYNSWNTWRIIGELSDIEKCLCFLAGGMPPSINLSKAVEQERLNCFNDEVVCEHFVLRFYKKGTVHLKFKDEELLAKFNRFGCQKKGWLPPCYGKRKYRDMTKEEQGIIDSFEGARAYSDVERDPQKHLVQIDQTLMLSENNS